MDLRPLAAQRAAEQGPHLVAPGGADPAGGLWDLGRATGAPADLAALGLTAAQADEAAAIVAESGAVGRDEVRELLDRALRGERPEVRDEEERTWTRSAATTT